MLSNALGYDAKIIQKLETGDIDKDRISYIIRGIANISVLFPGSNILLDMRETRLLEDIDMADAMKFAKEASVCTSIFSCKIASLIPEEEKRTSIAKKIAGFDETKMCKLKIFSRF